MCVCVGGGGEGIKLPTAKNPELSNVLSFKAGIGQNTALRASPAARNST